VRSSRAIWKLVLSDCRFQQCGYRSFPKFELFLPKYLYLQRWAPGGEKLSRGRPLSFMGKAAFCPSGFSFSGHGVTGGFSGLGKITGIAGEIHGGFRRGAPGRFFWVEKIHGGFPRGGYPGFLNRGAGLKKKYVGGLERVSVCRK